MKKADFGNKQNILNLVGNLNEYIQLEIKMPIHKTLSINSSKGRAKRTLPRI